MSVYEIERKYKVDPEDRADLELRILDLGFTVSKEDHLVDSYYLPCSLDGVTRLNRIQKEGEKPSFELTRKWRDESGPMEKVWSVEADTAQILCDLAGQDNILFLSRSRVMFEMKRSYDSVPGLNNIKIQIDRVITPMDLQGDYIEIELICEESKYCKIAKGLVDLVASDLGLTERSPSYFKLLRGRREICPAK